jgi:hypothetical protein
MKGGQLRVYDMDTRIAKSMVLSIRKKLAKQAMKLLNNGFESE